MEIGGQQVSQWVDLSDADNVLWHDLCGAYGNYGHYVTQHGDWTLWLTISKHALSRSVENLPHGANRELWTQLMAVVCDQYIFVYEDPTLRKRAERKRAREYKARGNSHNYP